jgi:methionyl-tRNA formyltransferase
VRLAFFGTSGFAVPALRVLAGSAHEVGLVVAAPAQPSGRGRKLVSSPVEQEARALGLEVLTPTDPNDPAFIAELKSRSPNAAVLAAYGYILKPALLAAPPLGFLNIHPSLLPRYRGAAPIQRAILAGEQETGVTVILLSELVDAGDIIEQEVLSIGQDETAGELSQRLAETGARLMLGALTRLGAGGATHTPQDPKLATRAPKIVKSERSIDWHDSAQGIHNRIRALSPEPGAVTTFRRNRIVLLRSRVRSTSEEGEPGELLVERAGLVVAAGSGTIEVIELKPEGKRTQSGRDFRNGHRPLAGEKFAA